MTGTPVTPALEARNISVRLSGQPVLSGLSLQIPAGRWTSIVGPNGAGKSTLLRALAGLLPHSGDVLLLGQSLHQVPARQRARTLAWLGQSEQVSDDLSVMDVAMLGRLPHQAWLASPGPEDLALVERSLRATQAWDWRDRPVSQLAGGERQRVLLARALAVDAQILLMDEPLSNLDPPHQSDFLCIARSLADMGCTVVSVLHEITMALQADDIVVMQQGRILHQGPNDAPATHDALQAVFDHRLRVVAIDGQWVALPLPVPHIHQEH